MDRSDLHARVDAAVPTVRAWIDELIAAHTARSRPVADAGFARLRDYFPGDVLQQVRVVTVGKAPVPPFSAMGLPEFSALEHMAAAGVTYRTLCFLHEDMATESTCFHELIHALEWQALGPRYVLTYAAGLLKYGYARSPLEVIAFDMQSAFDRSAPVPGLVAAVHAAALEAGREADAFFQTGAAT
jgi:hypothetical protein